MKSILSIASFVAAIVLALVGMWMPPPGQIDSSVLVLVAQLLVFCATVAGINLPLTISEKGKLKSPTS